MICVFRIFFVILQRIWLNANKIRNKYDYIYSVTDEEIEDLIGVLDQKQQDNHEKSL